MKGVMCKQTSYNTLIGCLLTLHLTHYNKVHVTEPATARYVPVMDVSIYVHMCSIIMCIIL